MLRHEGPKCGGRRRDGTRARCAYPSGEQSREQGQQEIQGLSRTIEEANHDRRGSELATPAPAKGTT
jgi:hypothetical protein